MDQSPRSPEYNEDTGTPRWVKVFGIILIVLIVALVVLHLTGNGFSRLHGLTPINSILAVLIESGIPQA